MNTFYLHPQAWGEPCVLKGPEYLHFKRVLRGRANDRIRLMDGRGRMGIFEVDQLKKDHARLRTIKIWHVPGPEVQLYLAPGWNKSLRRSWFLEKAGELGCRGICFWQAARSQGTVPSEPKDSWMGQIVSGAKQSLNPWLPDVCVHQSLAGLVNGKENFDSTIYLYQGEDEGLLGPHQTFPPGKHLLVIGPEGGFQDNEITLLQGNNFSPLSLGRRILRWETAALLCLGLFWWNNEHNSSM